MPSLETIVVTWMDGSIATYTDITFAIREGVLFIYAHPNGVPVLTWRFPTFNIRAVGSSVWLPDDILNYAVTDPQAPDAT